MSEFEQKRARIIYEKNCISLQEVVEDLLNKDILDIDDSITNVVFEKEKYSPTFKK